MGKYVQLSHLLVLYRSKTTPWTPTPIPWQLVPLPRRRPRPKEKGSSYDSPSAQNTSLARTWRFSWPCGHEEIRKFELWNHQKNLGVMTFRRLHMTMGLLGLHLWVVCTKIAVACNQPIRTHQGLQWSKLLSSLENFQEVMATGSHGQLTKPFHLTPGTAGMFQLINCLSASNSVLSLFWAKSHSSEQYTPADRETTAPIDVSPDPA